MDRQGSAVTPAWRDGCTVVVICYVCWISTTTIHATEQCCVYMFCPNQEHWPFQNRLTQSRTLNGSETDWLQATLVLSILFSYLFYKRSDGYTLLTSPNSPTVAIIRTLIQLMSEVDTPPLSRFQNYYGNTPQSHSSPSRYTACGVAKRFRNRTARMVNSRLPIGTNTALYQTCI